MLGLRPWRQLLWLLPLDLINPPSNNRPLRGRCPKPRRLRRLVSDVWGILCPKRIAMSVAVVRFEVYLPEAEQILLPPRRSHGAWPFPIWTGVQFNTAWLSPHSSKPALIRTVVGKIFITEMAPNLYKHENVPLLGKYTLTEAKIQYWQANT